MSPESPVQGVADPVICRPESVFLPIFLLISAAFAFLVPVGWNSDEPAHIMRAEQLSGGHILADVIDVDGRVVVGGQVPVGIVDLLVATRVYGEGGVFDPNFKVSNILESIPEAGDDVTVDVDFRNTAVYSPVAYLPQIPAFWIGNLLSLSFATVVLLGRIFALVCVAASTFWAIRIAPVGKWVFLAVGLLPSFVSQAAAFGADPAVLGFSMLFTATLVRVILRDGRPAITDCGVVLTFGAALSLTKVAYAPMLLLIFLVPLCNRAARTRRDLLVCTIGLLIALLPALIWSKLTGPASGVSLNPAADAGRQLSGVIDDPIQFVHVLYRTFLTTDPAGDVLSSLFGNFVWLSAPLPMAFVCVSVYTLVASVVVPDPRERTWLAPGAPARYFRGGMLLVAAGTVLVTAAGIYITFSTVQARVVEGLQGRYFLAVLPIALLACCGNSLIRRGAVKISIVLACVFVLLGGVATLVHRLY